MGPGALSDESLQEGVYDSWLLIGGPVFRQMRGCRGSLAPVCIASPVASAPENQHTRVAYFGVAFTVVPRKWTVKCLRDETWTCNPRSRASVETDLRAADESGPEGASGSSRDMPSKLRNPILARHVDTKKIDSGLGPRALAHLQRQREIFSKRKTDREFFFYSEAV